MDTATRYWNDRYSKFINEEENHNPTRRTTMKELKDINIKELKEVVKELNNSGLIKTKIKLVGIKNQKLLDEFTTVLAELDEDADVPQGIADFYNDLYADEITEEAGSEEDDDGDQDTDETDDEGEGDETDEGDDEGSEDSDDENPEDEEDVEGPEDGDELEGSDDDTADSEDADVPAPVSVKSKKDKKPLVVKDKSEPKKKTLGVEKRASINPKLSLTKKVTNLLNFADQRYKKTTYFPLDVETIRVLESNVGLYPTEILAAIKHDKKSAKKIEEFSAAVLIREINKIKSAYAYIVGAIKEDKLEGKFRNIMTTLLAGKEVTPDVAHYSTVKVARRALLAYMEVTGIDYSVMKDARKTLTKKASDKKEKAPASVPKKSESKPAPKAAEKKSSKKK